MRCAPWGSNGPNHLGLCALQMADDHDPRVGPFLSTAQPSRMGADKVVHIAAARTGLLAKAQAGHMTSEVY